MRAKPTIESGRRARSEGFILVAVLWIVGALATLATAYSIYVANTAIAVAVNDDAIQTEGLVSAGIELAAYQLIAAKREDRPTRGAFTFRLGRANVAVEFCSEAARIDLNAAPKELLSGLFRVLGAHPGDADQYAERIIGWRTEPSSDSPDKEAALYGAAGLSYGPRGAPFAHADELWLVLGLPPGFVARALPFVTVYSGREDVNVLDAAPEVVAALSGMTPERLNAFLAQRTAVTPGQGRSALAPLGAAQDGATTEGSNAVRVTVRAILDNGRHRVSEAVILVDGGSEPFRVLSWRDDVEGAADPRFALGRSR
jgi:general secretion pathway protein K